MICELKKFNFWKREQKCPTQIHIPNWGKKKLSTKLQSIQNGSIHFFMKKLCDCWKRNINLSEVMLSQELNRFDSWKKILSKACFGLPSIPFCLNWTIMQIVNAKLHVFCSWMNKKKQLFFSPFPNCWSLLSSTFTKEFFLSAVEIVDMCIIWYIFPCVSWNFVFLPFCYLYFTLYRNVLSFWKLWAHNIPFFVYIWYSSNMYIVHLKLCLWVKTK